MSNSEGHLILIDVARHLADKHASKLVELKKSREQLKRPDFVWHFLLQSFATMGRSAGWKGLIGNQTNYDRVTFEALSKLDTASREHTVISTCRAAGIRMPGKKADWILKCFEIVRQSGGPERIKDLLLNSPGADGKISFLKKFPGIGDKYSRNIMMDVYHEEFRDRIAIDARIKDISMALGVSFKNYTDHEKFYLSAAKSAKLEGWELDRLMYNFRDDFISAIHSRKNQPFS